MSSAAPLPEDVFRSAQHGELQKVVKWLRKGGPVDALCLAPTNDGLASTFGLVHVAATCGQLEMVRELLKRGASVDLPTSLGVTALMGAAGYGHLSIVLILLQHSASVDLQSNLGGTALMQAAAKGQKACVQALLRAKADTELVDEDGDTALQWAKTQGHTATAELIRQHAAPPQPAAASPAAPPDAGEPAESSPASLPLEIFKSARHGELQKVVEWLGKGGLVDALCSAPTSDGRASTFGLLHAAATNDRLEMVRELLKRGASVDLQSSLGSTALMEAAYHDHLSIVLVLLQHSANIDLQSTHGSTALIKAAYQGQEASMKALLRAKANTELLDGNSRTALQWAEAEGHTAIVALIRQHAAPPQPNAASPTAAPDAGEPVVSSSDPLPVEIVESAQKGELQMVVKWLRKGGPVDALCSASTRDGLASAFGLLHAAASNDHPEMVRELLKRGARVDLPNGFGRTALMMAAFYGRHSILLVLLQHSANIDLQNMCGSTALMQAAYQGQEACVQALLCAKANINLPDEDGDTALQYAESQGHTATAELIRQHTAPPQPAATAEAMQAEQATKADAAMEKLLAEEAAEQAKAQAPSKKSKKKKKAGRAAATGDEPREAPPAAAPALPPAATAPERAASAAEGAEAALRAAIAGCGLSALEVALAAAPREVREGGVGAEARARCDKLLKAQQEAEREAKQEAAAEAARLAEAKRVRAVAAREAARAAVASQARAAAAVAEQAVAAAAAAAAHAAAEQAVAAAERAAAERAAAERAEEDRNLDEALARSMASLQADEERRRATASSAATPDVPLPACPSSRPPDGGGSGRAGRGGRGGRGVPRGGRGGRGGGGVGRGGGAAAASAQPVLTLADAGDITGRNDVPESTIGGETTCIVCMAHPKSHRAVPCGHQSVCGICAQRMQDCPYCRAPVREWVHARVV